jgi:hypothetical protein
MAPVSPAPERIFLDWNELPLPRSARWLAERFGPDLSDVLVALPGGRAGRALTERLARELGPELRPPRIVTAGLASDELLEVRGAPAGRLVRTLAWRAALAELPPRELARVVARPPQRDDLAGWVRLAEEVRGLFGEVAAEGLQFASIATDPALAAIDGERRRWEVLAAAQAGMEARLAEAGFVDPHLGRLRAIEAGSVRPVRAAVLVGVSEMNALLRRALDLCPAPVTALVFAPEELAETFDAHGCLLPEAWSEWRTSLDPEKQWRVVDGPAEQAEQATRVLAGWNGKYAAEDVSLGIADREVSPYLKAALLEHDVRVRDAAGLPLPRTRPATLLAAVQRFLEGRRFGDLAALVRHPDLEAALRASATGLEALDLVDRYHNAHLPAEVDGRWLVDRTDGRDRELHAGMERLWSAAREALGALWTADDGAVHDVVPALRALLERVYGGRDLDPGDEAQRVLIAGLTRLGDALNELERLPPTLARLPSAGATIALLLRSVAGDVVPPPAARAGEPTIELLGWLELALDDAPALVVTGFEDGRVPESLHGDAYLPNRLRQSLGLADNERRLARDLYDTELLLRSRADVVFVTGRHDLARDPQVPSRIVFHCDADQVVARVQRFLDGGRPSAARVSSAAERDRELPRRADAATPASISVTAFQRFLESPYLFYLEHVLGLRTVDDRARELDPLGFGILAHDVLQAFGRDPEARGLTDEGALTDVLSSTLRRLGAERYGADPLPAVRLQLAQLDYRLARFATQQARRCAEGWEIRATEWTPADGHHELLVDDEPIRITGRIDRIDHHPATGRWAIWDYKTGDTPRRPAAAHRRRDGTWRDLQLPLYCLLATELLGEAPPAELGYAWLGRRDADVRFLPLEHAWATRAGTGESFEDGLASALETVADVVRRVRAGDFFTAEGFAPRDPILAAIGGVGLVTAAAAAEGAENGADDGEADA